MEKLPLDILRKIEIKGKAMNSGYARNHMPFVANEREKAYLAGATEVFTHADEYGLQEKHKWQLADNPPKENGRYITYDTNQPIAERIDVLRYSTYNDSWYYGADSYHPMYWMPLPNNPPIS